MKLKLSFLLAFFTVLTFAQKTTISGVLSDKDLKGAPLPFGNVNIKGTNLGATTDIDGKYALEVPAGTHTIVFSFLGYEPKYVSFTIAKGENKVINESIGSGSVTMEDVVVKASVSREKETALMLDQKKAVEIKQSIGAQEMSRKGVSDVEEGLTKITGISKVESRGLFVRGLEDRYNNLLINDLQAPSNSPFKKIIPLDLFPTDIVGVLNVYKTFNPNISGDFAGATINIETSQARNSTTKLSVGFGYTTQNNGEEFLIADNANTNKGFLGLNGKDRELPSAFGSVPASKKLTPAEYKENYTKNNWNVDNTTSPINSSIGFLHTDKISGKNNSSFNYIIALNGENKYQIRKGVQRTFNLGQGGNYDNNFNTAQYNYLTTGSALLGLRYKTNRFSIASNTFYIRSTESKIQDQLGYSNSLASKDNILIRTNQFEETNYLSSQLNGEIKLSSDNAHTVKAGAAFYKTSFEQPDRKFIYGEKTADNQIEYTYGGNHLNRQYLDVKGNYFISALAEYNYKFKENTYGKSNKLAVGYNGSKNELTSKYRFFSGKSIIPITKTVALNTIDSAISNDIENGLLYVQEESNSDYKIKMDQFINAGYVNLFWNFGQNTEINAGLRAENADRKIQYRTLGMSNREPYLKQNENKLLLLPSVNAKYALNDKTNLRLAISKTVTRPVTMELLPVEYVNPDGTVELGNNELKNSDNINIDLKYELFPNAKELLVVGLFGKKINNPIERLFVPTASSGGQIVTYGNSKNATLFGAELEFILQLNRINQALSNFSFGLNTSLMKTSVTVDKVNNPAENAETRKLQGASEWLVNSDLKYEFEFNKEMKNTISLVYGVYGDRIYAVGTQGIDHIYEKPFHKLDFVWSSKLSEKIEAKLAIDNLLNPAYRMELGKESTQIIRENSLITREFKKGVGFSLNLAYTF